MKIAILQLNRLGDILQTIPAINAYHRQHPNHQIHLIVREKFIEAAQLCPHVDDIKVLSTRYLLEPLIQDAPIIPESLSRLETWLIELANQDYDMIVNMSYSPLSSWIVRFIQEFQSSSLVVKGYTRTSDGFLAIPDDMSAYVYAQCGTHKPNRFHLSDIFGTLLGVDLEPQDWKIKKTDDQNISHLSLPQNYLALHLCASTPDKSIPRSVALNLISALKQKLPLPIVLLGGDKDSAFVNEIIQGSPHPSLINLVGKLSLSETAGVITRAQVLIAPDSSLQNLASLTGTKTLLLPFGQVNFWETGPRSSFSFVLTDLHDDLTLAQRAVEATRALINQQNPAVNGYLVTPSKRPCYQANFHDHDPFTWHLLNFIYLGEDIPVKPTSTHYLLALSKIEETNRFIIEILSQCQSPQKLADLKPFLERAEEIMDAIYQLSPDVQPIIDWYRTEKLRIAPGTLNEIYTDTLHVHHLLQQLVEALTDQAMPQLLEASPS